MNATSFWLIFGAVSIAFYTNCSAPSSNSKSSVAQSQIQLTGAVEGLQSSPSGNLNLLGWACEVGTVASISVQLFNTNQPAVSLATVQANAASEPQIAVNCGTNASQYRFEISMTDSLLALFAQNNLIVKAVSSDQSTTATLSVVSPDNLDEGQLMPDVQPPSAYQTFAGDPTGISDSSAACIQEATAGALPIFVPAGKYLFTKPCVLQSGTMIWATPGTATFLTDTIANPQGIFQITGASNINVTGITFDGNSDSTVTATRLVFVNGGSHIVFRRCTFQNSSGKGIAFGGDTTAITNSGVFYSRFLNLGMAWLNTVDAPLTDAAGAVAFANGVTAANSGNFIKGSYFHAIGSDSADINAQSNFYFDLNNLDLDGLGWLPKGHVSTYGIGGVWFLNGTSNSQIANNLINGATGQCVGSGSGVTSGSLYTPAISSNITIKNNIIENCGGDAIAMGNTDGFSIVGNYLLNNYQSANPPYQFADIINQGAISFLCGAQPVATIAPGCAYGANDSKNGTISNNYIIDNQTVHTMPYGFWKQGGVLNGVTWGNTLENVVFDSTNVISGAVIAPFGGGLMQGNN